MYVRLDIDIVKVAVGGGASSTEALCLALSELMLFLLPYTPHTLETASR